MEKQASRNAFLAGSVRASICDNDVTLSDKAEPNTPYICMDMCTRSSDSE